MNHHCLCGCGATIHVGYYLPGHSTRHVTQQINAVKRGSLTPEQALVELPASTLRNELAARLRDEGWVFDGHERAWTRA